MAEAAKISRLPMPPSLRGIPRLKMPASSLQTQRVTRRSMSCSDLRSAGSARNPPSNGTMTATAQPIQRATSTQVLNRKRPAAVASGLSNIAHGGKRPLMQSNPKTAKPTAPPTTFKKPVSQAPTIAAGKRKVAAWDTKGQLEIANGKIERLQRKNDELERVSAEAQTMATQKSILEEERQNLMQQLCDAKKEIDANNHLAAQNSKLSNDVDRLEARIKILTDQIELSRSDLNNAHQRIINLELELSESKNQTNDWKEKHNQVTSKLKESEENNEKYLEKIFFHEQTRRKMLNQILDLKGNIRVFCRVRPALESEKDKSLCLFSFPDECTLEMKSSQDQNSTSKVKGDKAASFSYDKVFPPSGSQMDIYLELSQLVQSALDGYNVCVFAYGQTGSGKTFTMEGAPDIELQGMIPRAIETIFQSIEEQKRLGWDFTVKCSFIEIYNEVIKDLLNPNSKLSHDIKMADSNSDDVIVTNLQVEVVSSEAGLHKLLARAQKNRFVAATFMNDRSSRSHSITQIKLEGFNRHRKLECQGTLNLIDLAGSEKFRIENKSDRQVETCNINKSLASLSHVVLKLAEKAEHIPFRDSKLTYLLMPSLKGNSKTLMLVNIAPFEDCFTESMSSLRFASRVSSVKVNAKRQIKASVKQSK